MYNLARPGTIEVIAGVMFSGKSEELLRRIRRALIARRKVQVFKPSFICSSMRSCFTGASSVSSSSATWTTLFNDHRIPATGPVIGKKRTFDKMPMVDIGYQIADVRCDIPVALKHMPRVGGSDI